MKKLVLFIVFFNLLYSWDINKTIKSEGIVTYLIKCKNKKIKAIYYRNNKYEITPDKKFTDLKTAAKIICEE